MSYLRDIKLLCQKHGWSISTGGKHFILKKGNNTLSASISPKNEHYALLNVERDIIKAERKKSNEQR